MNNPNTRVLAINNEIIIVEYQITSHVLNFF